jgi:hypothetical protein
MIKPINVLMSNIALFSENGINQKGCSQWLYQLLNAEDNNELKEILNSNKNLSFLKKNKYFTVKSLA